ncbi:hypothetical protein D3C75_535190 [compost metagenome]
MPIEQHLLVMFIFFAEGLIVFMHIFGQRILINPVIQIRQHWCAVNADPMEQIVREDISVIPAQLGGHKIFDSTMLQNLRQRGAVAEGIRQPLNLRGAPELFQIKALAIQHLPHQRFSARNVQIRFDPHSTDQFPASFTDARLDLLIEYRVIVFQIFEQQRLALRILIVRIFVHQGIHRRERPASLAHGLARRPQPSNIDMGLAHHVDCSFGMTADLPDSAPQLLLDSRNLTTIADLLRGKANEFIHRHIQSFQHPVTALVLLRQQNCRIANHYCRVH